MLKSTIGSIADAFNVAAECKSFPVETEANKALVSSKLNMSSLSLLVTMLVLLATGCGDVENSLDVAALRDDLFV